MLAHNGLEAINSSLTVQCTHLTNTTITECFSVKIH